MEDAPLPARLRWKAELCVSNGAEGTVSEGETPCMEEEMDGTYDEAAMELNPFSSSDCTLRSLAHQLMKTLTWFYYLHITGFIPKRKAKKKRN